MQWCIRIGCNIWIAPYISSVQYLLHDVVPHWKAIIIIFRQTANAEIVRFRYVTLIAQKFLQFLFI